MKAWVARLVVWAPCTLASPALAQMAPSDGARLRVEPSADGCITQSSVTARVGRWLRGASRAPLEFVVDGSATPAGFVVLRDGSRFAERRFERWPVACNERLDALAIAIAIAIEQATGEDVLAEDSTAAEPATAPPAVPPTAPDEPSKPPETKPAAPAKPPKGADERPEAEDEEPAPGGPIAPPARLRLHLLGGLHAGILPSEGLVFGAGADWLVLAPLSLHVTALFAPPVESELDGRLAETWLVGGRALACLGLELGQLGLAGCAGVGSGAAVAKGVNFEKNRDATMGWLAGVLGVSGTFPSREWLALRLALDGFGNLFSPRLRVTRGQDRPSGGPIGGLVSLALVLALP